MRLLFFSDTHLGIDLPLRPRSDRRRRGHDFFDNFDRVLTYAREERVDLVLHGGDLFFRSRVPPPIVDMVYERLVGFADCGIPVGLIAGNHERSVLPQSLLLGHPGIHVFGTPGTHAFDVGGTRVAVTGFPFVGDGARLGAMLASLRSADADVRLLLVHEAIEGATVGPANYVFRDGADVVAMRALPEGFDAYLSGHIHRRQVLWRQFDDGRRVPVVYPGSIERTSFAEKDEEKGFVVIDFAGRRGEGGRIRFMPLPARPMIDVELDVDAMPGGLDRALAQLPGDAIIRITCPAEITDEVRRDAQAALHARGIDFQLRVRGEGRARSALRFAM